MKTWFVLVVSILSIVACAPAAEPETPPQPAPRDGPNDHERVRPPPSSTPEIVYARAIQPSKSPSADVM